MKTISSYIKEINGIIQYCEDNKSNIVFLPRLKEDEIGASLKDRTESSGRVTRPFGDNVISLKDYLFDNKEMLNVYSILNSLRTTIENDEGIKDVKIKVEDIEEFKDYVDNTLLPKYQAYLQEEDKYKTIYLLQFDSSINDIRYRKHAQLLNTNDPEDKFATIAYREIDTCDTRIKALNRYNTTRPTLSVQKYGKLALLVSMWSLEDNIDNTIKIIYDYVDNELKNVFNDLYYHYNEYTME